ncbi:MAG: hypothetical protein K2X01_05235 [Cyanobacteria bacterium]|nr:hypothetical protein [Cyanobacteriota bacterium]
MTISFSPRLLQPRSERLKQPRFSGETRPNDQWVRLKGDNAPYLWLSEVNESMAKLETLSKLAKTEEWAKMALIDLLGRAQKPTLMIGGLSVANGLDKHNLVGIHPAVARAAYSFKPAWTVSVLGSPTEKLPLSAFALGHIRYPSSDEANPRNYSASAILVSTVVEEVERLRTGKNLLGRGVRVPQGFSREDMVNYLFSLANGLDVSDAMDGHLLRGSYQPILEERGLIQKLTSIPGYPQPYTVPEPIKGILQRIGSINTQETEIKRYLPGMLPIASTHGITSTP